MIVTDELMIHIVFTSEKLYEVAISSWLELFLSTRPLNSVQTLETTDLSDHEFNSHSDPTLCAATSISSLVQCHISFSFMPPSVTRLFESKFSSRNYMSVAE